MTAYTIRLASPSDVDSLMELRLEAEEWLRAAGVRQWTEDYAEHGHQVLRDAIAQGHAWLITAGAADVAGTVTLDGPDLDLWDPEDDPDDALYVYKMIVTRGHHGCGLGDAILNWASLQASAAGRTWLRLDCRRDNLKLHSYYKVRGFDHLRTVTSPRRATNSGALFQRRAGLLAYGPPPADPRAVLTERKSG